MTEQQEGMWEDWVGGGERSHERPWLGGAGRRKRRWREGNIRAVSEVELTGLAAGMDVADKEKRSTETES